eukprot:9172657-Ditylum_brightwellii.AAC.1
MGETSKDDNRLAIGAFKAAFCADTGTYQDDGLTIFDSQKTVQEAIKWACDFQLQVDEVVGGTFFQFTAEVWNPLETRKLSTTEEDILADKWRFWAEKVTVIKESAFPYLDMQLLWKDEELYFSVYSKKNQMIKYVNKESCHCNLVFKAVPVGLFTCLRSLTSLTESNHHSPSLDLYPLHAAALRKANLLPKNIPAIRDLYQQEDDRRRRQKKKEEEVEKRQDGRTCYF